MDKAMASAMGSLLSFCKVEFTAADLASQDTTAGGAVDHINGSFGTSKQNTARKPPPLAAADVIPAAGPDAQTPKRLVNDFDTAFARLDEKGGGHNHVRLVELRKALPQYSRPMVDAHIQSLRRSGRYRLTELSSYDGGLSADELDACIAEDGQNLGVISAVTR